MNCTDFEEEEIDKKLREALEILIKNDSYLLKNDVNERSITHILAIYLKQIFDGWDVDCEYNRDINERKKILHEICPPCPRTTNSNDTTGKTVYPDLIIHHRLKRDNLVVIEVKKSTNSTGKECDIAKLKAFKKEFCYRYAIFLLLKTGDVFNTSLLNNNYNLEFIKFD
jgi:hypothetical protein